MMFIIIIHCILFLFVTILTLFPTSCVIRKFISFFLFLIIKFAVNSSEFGLDIEDYLIGKF